MWALANTVKRRKLTILGKFVEFFLDYFFLLF